MKPKSVITRRHVVKRDAEGRILDIVEEQIPDGEVREATERDEQLAAAVDALTKATSTMAAKNAQDGVSAQEISEAAAEAVVSAAEKTAVKAAAAILKRNEAERAAKAAAAVKKNAEMESWGLSDYGLDRDATTFSTVKKPKKPIAHDSAESFRGPAAEAAIVEDEKVRKFLGDGEKFLRGAVQTTGENLLAVAKATITVCKVIGRIDALAELERLRDDIERLLAEGSKPYVTADPPTDDGEVNVHLWRKKVEKVAAEIIPYDDRRPEDRNEWAMGPAKWRRRR